MNSCVLVQLACSPTSHSWRSPNLVPFLHLINLHFQDPGRRSHPLRRPEVRPEPERGWRRAQGVRVRVLRRHRPRVSLRQPLRLLPPAAEVPHGWRPCRPPCPEGVHHHPPSPHCARCPHHRAGQEVLPPRPDQAGQVPPGIQLPVPVSEVDKESDLLFMLTYKSTTSAIVSHQINQSVLI